MIRGITTIIGGIRGIGTHGIVVTITVVIITTIITIITMAITMITITDLIIGLIITMEDIMAGTDTMPNPARKTTAVISTQNHKSYPV